MNESCNKEGRKNKEEVRTMRFQGGIRASPSGNAASVINSALSAVSFSFHSATQIGDLCQYCCLLRDK